MGVGERFCPAFKTCTHPTAGIFYSTFDKFYDIVCIPPLLPEYLTCQIYGKRLACALSSPPRHFRVLLISWSPVTIEGRQYNLMMAQRSESTVGVPYLCTQPVLWITLSAASTVRRRRRSSVSSCPTSTPRNLFNVGLSAVQFTAGVRDRRVDSAPIELRASGEPLRRDRGCAPSFNTLGK